MSDPILPPDLKKLLILEISRSTQTLNDPDGRPWLFAGYVPRELTVVRLHCLHTLDPAAWPPAAIGDVAISLSAPLHQLEAWVASSTMPGHQYRATLFLGAAQCHECHRIHWCADPSYAEISARFAPPLPALPSPRVVRTAPLDLPATGSDFASSVRNLLVAEYNKSPEQAAALVKKYTDLVIAGIMTGPMAVGGTAMAIEMAEERASSDRLPHLTS